MDDADYGLVMSSTRVYDEFESLSLAQRHHTKPYAIGLVAPSNKTVADIARKASPAGGKRALNKFLTECDWDNSSSTTNGLRNSRTTVKRAGQKTATLSSAARSPRNSGAKSPASAGSTITPKETLY